MRRNSLALTSRVLSEKADAVVKTQGLGLTINSLLAMSSAAILYLADHDGRVALWLCASLGVNGLRWACLCSGQIRRMLGISAPLTLRLCLVFNSLSGLLWSLVPALLIDLRSTEAPFVTIVLCGLTAGAAVQGGAYALPVLAFATPILITITVKFTLLGTPSGMLLGVDTILYLGMIVRSCRGAESAFSKLAQLRWEADALAADLRQQHDAARVAAQLSFELANHDALTGVANRAKFNRELGLRLDSSQVSGDRCALLLLDLDHFKNINDTLGHGVGDEVLRAVTNRITEVIDRRHLLARLGGDEFCVLTDLNAYDAGLLSAKLVQANAVPLIVDEHPITVGLSVGLACYPEDASTSEELLTRADLALYAVKAAGRQGWQRFVPSLLTDAETARDVEGELLQALAAGLIEVWFQPQVEILSGRLIGLEALIRWRHPRVGWVPPPMIVSAARKLRASRLLTECVLQQACQTVKELDVYGLENVCVGFNVSPQELDQYDLHSLVSDVLAESSVNPTRLELEITEEATIGDRALASFSAVQRCGLRLAVDDFGAGSSSISYLQKLCVDRIKIDRSFVEDLVASEGDRVLVGAIIGMGRSLGVEVIAEGVETVEEALVLSNLGCHQAQGYHYGAAQSPVALTLRLLEEQERRANPQLASVPLVDGAVRRRA